jgi:hypothetical protein
VEQEFQALFFIVFFFLSLSFSLINEQLTVEKSSHYKHLQLCPKRKCKIGMGKTYTQFYRKWSEVKNKLY